MNMMNMEGVVYKDDSHSTWLVGGDDQARAAFAQAAAVHHQCITDEVVEQALRLKEPAQYDFITRLKCCPVPGKEFYTPEEAYQEALKFQEQHKANWSC